LKSSGIKIAIKMPMPVSRAVKAGQAAAAFAHHPPAIKEEAKMERPRGGKGPKNPGA
jgi:hypothetical protein